MTAPGRAIKTGGQRWPVVSLAGRPPARPASLTRSSAIREAWREWTTCWSGAVDEAVLFRRAPRWFVDEELGFSFGEAPPLTLTLSRLEEVNRAARVVLGPAAPREARRPRSLRLPISEGRYRWLAEDMSTSRGVPVARA